jgi:hypothetical protein
VKVRATDAVCYVPECRQILMVHDEHWWSIMSTRGPYPYTHPYINAFPYQHLQIIIRPNASLPIHDECWWPMMSIDDPWWVLRVHGEFWWSTNGYWWSIMTTDGPWWVLMCVCMYVYMCVCVRMYVWITSTHYGSSLLIMYRQYPS